MGYLLDLTFLLLLFYVSTYYYKYFTRSSPLPGPFPIPLFGNIFELLRTKGDFAKLNRIMHEKYGDMREFYIFSDRQIWLSRPDVVEKLFSKKMTKSHYFHRSHEIPGLNELELDSQGLSLIRDYEKWRINRKFFSQALLTARFKQSWLPTAQSLFAQMEEYWSKLDLNKPIDMAQWTRNFSADMLSKISICQDLNFMAAYFDTIAPDELKKAIHLSERFETAFVERIFAIPARVFFLTLFPPWVRHYIPGFRQKNQQIIEQSYELYHCIETEIVRKRRNEIENTPIGQELTNDLLTQLCIFNTPHSNVKITDANGHCNQMTDYEIGRLMNDAFFAGTDTIANSICYIIYYLCKYPQVKTRLLTELDTVIGSGPIIFEHLEKLTYLTAVIKELYRLIPVTHSVGRLGSLESEIHGYHWPAGTIFRVDVVGVHRHPSKWTDPESFIPERWLKETKNTQNRLFTFGGGIRECPGRILADIELKTFICLLFKKYNITLANEELKTSSDLVLMQCKELKVLITPKHDISTNNK